MATTKKVVKKAAAKKIAKKTVTKPRTVRRAPTAAGNSPDAVAFLMKDHRDAKALFRRFEKAERASQKEEICNHVCKLLQVHTKIEEEIFYPACRQAGLDQDQMDEADIEHASAKDLIAQVEGKSAKDSHYDAKVKVLGEYVEHHVKEEETEMFKQARRLKLDMHELGRQMKQRAAELKVELGLAADGSIDKSSTMLARLAATVLMR
jgi:hypothetical protein